VTLLLVSGTRHATIADHGLTVQRAIVKTTGWMPEGEPLEIYVGDEPDGVDAIITALCRRNGWQSHIFEAEWEACGPGCPQGEHRRRRRTSGEEYCPYAGPRRNRAMIRAFAADGGKDVLGFPAANAKSSGTRGCMREARRAGLIVAPPVLLTVEVRRGSPSTASRGGGNRS
jgi:hypothetical protein